MTNDFALKNGPIGFIVNRKRERENDGSGLLDNVCSIGIVNASTAPALIVVGFMMLSCMMSIDYNDFTEAVPAFIAAIMMPFTYSIAEGIAMGVISYVIVNIFAGSKEKNVSGVTYLLALVFILKYIFV